MLRLKKVEILGFKSFCERTELRFNGGGIAAIVGPNGCGKSNLSDAISWVLGEQSARVLRGARMEDVIFNGTRERKPLGLASVTVTLIDPEVSFYESNAPLHGSANGGTAIAGDGNGAEPEAIPAGRRRKPPAERPGEICVTRRLFRNGDSEYMLNGRLCRLRDIQEIFMGTGLGPECYAIIEQGRIEQILSSRPHDRRAVVEEAAGVTKFKTKKKLAEARLESASHNLARVHDILEEVGRQVNSLKRQAAKARRYQELRAEMTRKLALALGSRYRRTERQALQGAVDLNLASEELRKHSARAESLEAEHSTVQKESFELETVLENRREALTAAALETDRARQRMDYQTRLGEENAARIQQAEGELASIGNRIEQLTWELGSERASAEKLGEEVASARDRLAAKSVEVDLALFQVREREAEQDRLRQLVLELLGASSALGNQRAQVEEFLSGLERQANRARAEEAAAAAEVEQIAAARQALLTRLAAERVEMESLEQRRRQTEASLAARRQQAQTLREQSENLRAEISRLQARRESLEEILSHRAYTTETVKNLFAALSQGRTGDFRARGILADFLEVDPRYEKAAEEFLREELEYVVVDSWEQAERGMRLARAEMEGHLTFLVSSGAPAPPPLGGPDTGIVGRLGDHTRLSDGLAGAGWSLLPRLRDCWLAEDEGAALSLSQQYPDRYFLLPHGVWYHGATLNGGRKNSSGPLALKRELRELAPRLSAAERQLEEQAGELAAVEAGIAAQSGELDALLADLREREKGLAAAEQEARQIQDRGDRAGSRWAAIRLEISRIEEETARASAERRRLDGELHDREQERHGREQALAAARAAMIEDQERAARAADEQVELRAQVAALDERRKAALASAARVEQVRSAEIGRREETDRQKQAWAAERDRLLEDNRRLEQLLAELAGRQRQAEQEARQAESGLQQRRARMLEIEEILRAAKQELEQARERRSAIELDLVRLRSDLQHVQETCQRELGRPIAEIAAAEPSSPELAESEEVEQEYQQLKEKIEALGPVNVLALEEYQEAQQRFEFLDTQRQDLVDSIRDTQQAIAEIDSVSRRQFLEAFQEINRNFRQTFITLFGGGLGEMRLTDEANLAESGVDIVASPPGKRLQNVLLLSGGEKALTAIALLMAVFQYQPSPFCILDEVDAPLDEANIGRFTRLIREMSERTQFILITHSKSTMEVAETLYGVTMQEPGVSRLVSVKLAEPRGKLPPPPSPAVENLAHV